MLFEPRSRVRRSAGALLSLLCLAVGPIGCSDDDDPPPAPIAGGDGDGDGSTGGTGGRTGDASVDEDAGSGEGPRASCRNVDGLTGPGAVAEGITSTTAPDDFVITRVDMVYDCADPALVITLSNGGCPNGGAHALTLRISTDAIADGLVPLGVTELKGTTNDVIDASYRRPNTSPPVGEYGNCGSDNYGALNFASPPTLGGFDTIEAEFQLQLAGCDPIRDTPLVVRGYFSGQLRQSFADACN